MKRHAVLTVLALLAAFATVPAIALYDPFPDPSLSAVQGEWHGALTYRDYSNPDRRVTLPTRLFVTLGSPAELVLHYVFDDGPAKTVYSYERMGFDFAAGQVRWESGTTEKSLMAFDIVANTTEAGVRRLVFERRVEKGIDRYTMELSARELKLAKDEVDASGTPQLRNKYEFTRKSASDSPAR